MFFSCGENIFYSIRKSFFENYFSNNQYVKNDKKVKMLQFLEQKVQKDGFSAKKIKFKNSKIQKLTYFATQNFKL